MLSFGRPSSGADAFDAQAEVLWLFGDDLDLNRAVETVRSVVDGRLALWVAVARNRGARSRSVAEATRTAVKFAGGAEAQLRLDLGSDVVFGDLGRPLPDGDGMCELLTLRGAKSVAVLAAPAGGARVPDLAIEALHVAMLRMWAALAPRSVLNSAQGHGFHQLIREAVSAGQFVVSRIVPESLGPGIAVTGPPGWIEAVSDLMSADAVPSESVLRATALAGRWPV